MRLAQELHCHLCAPKQFLSSGVTHVSSMVVLSRAFLHEHFLFFTCLSYHTPRTLSASRTSPSSLSRQVAPSRITLAWRPAEWRKPAHHNSHRTSGVERLKQAFYAHIRQRRSQLSLALPASLVEGAHLFALGGQVDGVKIVFLSYWSFGPFWCRQRGLLHQLVIIHYPSVPTEDEFRVQRP